MTRAEKRRAAAERRKHIEAELCSVIEDTIRDFMVEHPDIADVKAVDTDRLSERIVLEASRWVQRKSVLRPQEKSIWGDALYNVTEKDVDKLGIVTASLLVDILNQRKKEECNA